MNTPAPAWMRWTFVPLGFLSNLCAGTVYAWSVFRKPVESELGISAGASGWPFLLLLAGFSITMFFTGAVIARIGPRATALAGAALTSGSYLLSAHASSLLGLVVAYGLIGGLGVGLSYAVPLAVITRWFDCDRGLALGCALIGFGLSPLVTAPLARHLIAEGGPERAFTVLGWLFLAVMGICALAMRFPAADGTQPDA
ncbi:MAG: MFS transporter, partial [Terrimicrobiaceae bacterium]|nr:MFS transporter [Terrimicrobiaceae bacterium]